MENAFETSDLLVFSHIRWDSILKRPQHIMVRHALHRRVYYIEEPVVGMSTSARFHIRGTPSGVQVIVPYLPDGLESFDFEREMIAIIDDLIAEENIRTFDTWYYTPMALPYSRHLQPGVTIYDCMDELSKVKGAPSHMVKLETELLKRADLVFAGGLSLYEAKRGRHKNIHLLPGSVDYRHFARARTWLDEPADQAFIPHPRLGFFGTIDDRIDYKLIEEIALLKPDWQFILVGPVNNEDPISLPTLPNIHYLGQKDYQELPMYLAGWDVALLPYARKESTRFISPASTLEYLAAGRPVVSTSVRDVVRPFAQEKLVYIADRPVDFVGFCEAAMKDRAENPQWIKKVDEFVSGMSWDGLWKKMAELEHDFAILRTRKHTRRRYDVHESVTKPSNLA